MSQETKPRDEATTILLVRHAEVDNPDKVLYGRLPGYPLSEGGCRQADDLAVSLADRPVSVIYHSPLLRARQTAQRIARHHPDAPLRQSSLLHEVGSAWEGTPFNEFRDGFSTYHDRREDADETMDDIRERMLRFVDLVLRRHPGECVVAVSHGDPITILRVALKGRPVTLEAIRGDEYADLCSITEITLYPGREKPGIAYLSATDDDRGKVG